MENPIPITLTSVWGRAYTNTTGSMLALPATSNASWVIPGFFIRFGSMTPSSELPDSDCQLSIRDTISSYLYFDMVLPLGLSHFPFPRPIKFPKSRGVTFWITTLPTNYAASLFIPGPYLE